MRVGVPKEIKNREGRVALTPAGAGLLTAAGHQLAVERGAGEQAGFGDQDYLAAGVALVDAAGAWNSQLVLKVKEPVASEYPLLQGQILFTYLHLAGVDPALSEALLRSGCSAIAYETVEDADGRLPLLAPMSAVAGSMATTVGNYYLSSHHQGCGMMLGQLFEQRYGKVVVIGDGVVGLHAARVADRLGAGVSLFGQNLEKKAAVASFSSANVDYKLSTDEAITAELPDTDLVVGAVLLRGARAPHVVSEAMVKCMPAGAVIVDVSVDQGGCVETIRPTSHDAPVFVKHGVVHYGVTNMPGAYPRLSTLALTKATLPYVQRLAAEGLAALDQDPGFAKGLNIHRGQIVCSAVADALGLA